MMERRAWMILIWIAIIAAVVIILFGDQIGKAIMHAFDSQTGSMLDQILK